MDKILENIISNYREKTGNIITLLQDTQEAFGYIPKEAIVFYSEELGIASSRFYGVATFYAQFYLNPRGKNIITACCGTACHVKGSERLINNIRRELNLDDAQITTEDMKFTIEQVACVGACSIAPVVIINKKVHRKMTSDKILKELKALKETADE